jgi:hypothetical protein
MYFIFITKYTGIYKMQTQYRKADIVNLENLHNSYENTEHDILNDYTPYNITGLQHYNPIFSCFFELNETNIQRTTLNHQYAIHDLHSVINTETGELFPKPVFIKFSPLLDPIKYMIGKYDVSDDAIRTLPRLPTVNTNTQTCHPKLAEKNNASYIDCFFSYLSSQLLHRHGLVNAIDFYGSYLGIQEKYKMNVSDDIEYLCTSRFFNENVGKLFKLSEEIPTDGNYGDGSRGNKRRLNIQSSLKSHNISIVDLDIIDLDVPTDIPVLNEADDLVNENKNEVIYEKHNHSTTESSDSSSDSNLNYSTDEDDDGDQTVVDHSGEYEDDSENEDDEDGDQEEDEDHGDEEEDEEDEEDDEEEMLFSYMDNFPIQMICLEKCDGTIDQLFDEGELSKKEGASAMMQIVMTLIAYQRAFSFTHNDLHTNNIMYVNTDIEFLYYKYNKKTYQVPTYGRIFKIIDFGRSIYRFCGETFCSDSFAPGGDAATQYNCEPYMNEEKPRLGPNPSFDLCRLGCSIYDFLIDEETEDNMDSFQKTIYRWCCDDNRKNILYKRYGEERYPNFKLYKMIARSVHHHTPSEQLRFPFFSQFALAAKDVKKMDKDVAIIDIDEIPSYM